MPTAAFGFPSVPMALAALFVACAAVFAFFRYRRMTRMVRGESYAERAKLQIDLYKSSIETIALVGAAVSALAALMTYMQQTEKTAQDVAADRRKQNSEQFLVAINLLKEGTLGSTVGAIVVLDEVVRSDAASFRLPTRKILQAALYEIQSGREAARAAPAESPEKNGALRLQRLVEAYIRTYPGGASGCGPDASATVDLRFLRVEGLVFPDVRGYCIDFSNARLPKSDFSKARLTAHFDRADLTDANFREADLRGSTFVRAILRNATFTQSDLSRVDLTGARLDGANLQSVGSLQCANLRAVEGPDAQIAAQSLVDAKIYPETQQLGLVSYQQVMDLRRDLKQALHCD